MATAARSMNKTIMATAARGMNKTAECPFLFILPGSLPEASDTQIQETQVRRILPRPRPAVPYQRTIVHDLSWRCRRGSLSSSGSRAPGRQQPLPEQARGLLNLRAPHDPVRRRDGREPVGVPHRVAGAADPAGWSRYRAAQAVRGHGAGSVLGIRGGRRDDALGGAWLGSSSLYTCGMAHVSGCRPAPLVPLGRPGPLTVAHTSPVEMLEPGHAAQRVDRLGAAEHRFQTSGAVRRRSGTTRRSRRGYACRPAFRVRP